MSDIQDGDVIKTNGGYCTVVRYISAIKILVEFNDDHKHQKYVTARWLRLGSIKNPFYPNIFGIGFMGVGSYKVTDEGRTTKSYEVWHNMLMRCYDPNIHKKHPTYSECTVCKEWYNYQVFAEWYNNHKYCRKDYEIDKDLLIQGNKIYSPETCLMIPSEINTLLIDSGASRGKYPIGVNYHIRDKVYQARVSINGKSKYLGYYDCPDKAHEVYLSHRNEYIIEKAKEYRDRIDTKAFDALIRWSNK